MSCIEGKGGLKDIHCSAQHAALFVDILWKTYFFKINITFLSNGFAPEDDFYSTNIISNTTNLQLKNNDRL